MTLKERSSCLRCCRLKVRCHVQQIPGAPCGRCSRGGHDCVADQLPPPRRRWSAAEQEKRIGALEESLSQTQGAIASVQQFHSPAPAEPVSGNVLEQLLESRTLQLHDAIFLYNHFMTVLNKVHPFGPAGLEPFDKMRARTPILLLSMLYAATGCVPKFTELSEILDKVLKEDLFRRIVHDGECGIDLIQAILVTAQWGLIVKPTAGPSKQLALIGLAHSCSIMSGFCQNFGQLDVESRRIWVHLFTSCGSYCINMGVPSMVSWTNYLEECCELLEKNAETHADIALSISARLIASNHDMHSLVRQPRESIDLDRLRDKVESYEQLIETGAVEIAKYRQFHYWQCRYHLFDLAFSILAPGDPCYIEWMQAAIAAAEGGTTCFISNAHRLHTFPSFIFYKPLNSIMSLFNYKLFEGALDAPIDVRGNLARVSRCLESLDCGVGPTRVLALLNVIENSFGGSSDLAPSLVDKMQQHKNPQVKQSYWEIFRDMFDLGPISETEFWANVGLS